LVTSHAVVMVHAAPGVPSSKTAFTDRRVGRGHSVARLIVDDDPGATARRAANPPSSRRAPHVGTIPSPS
jgi:hypothetical protein